jgi:UDP-GlcNAc:undecaprenyl-phosphate GlcNAc-1-phosphate transferase
MKFLLAFLYSFAGVFIITPILRRIAFKFNILDLPGERKVHTKATALLGGIAVALIFFVNILFFAGARSPALDSILLGALIILLFGFWDDLKKISAGLRLFAQLLVVSLLIANSVTLTLFPQTFPLFLLRYAITIIWIVGITNAFNIIDGLDGLCVGTAGIASFCFAVVAFFTHQDLILTLSLVLLGCCLGFLPHNLRSTKIFLGDSGSNFFGFMLSCIAILGVWAEDRIVGISIPILILGVPIFDMTFTTIMRIKEGKVRNVREWLEYTGKDHFHHRLVDLGLRPKGAVLFIYLVSTCLGISAMALLRATWKIAILLLIQAAAVFAMVGVLMVVGGRHKSGWGSPEKEISKKA